MKSTGEVMGISKTLGESFRRASISAGNIIPSRTIVFISVNNADKLDVIHRARDRMEIGFKLIATSGTARELKRNGLQVTSVFKVGEGRPNVVDGIKNGEINLVINTPMGAQARYDEESIGRACIQKGIVAITTLSGASAAVRAIRLAAKPIQVQSIQEYHA
jgi:carbamoyl-phosphate synthase large subunit